MDVTPLQQRVSTLETRIARLDEELASRAAERKAMQIAYEAACRAYDDTTQLRVDEQNAAKSHLQSAKDVVAEAERQAASLAAEQAAVQTVREQNAALKARMAELEKQLNPPAPPVVEEPPTE